MDMIQHKSERLCKIGVVIW